MGRLPLTHCDLAVLRAAGQRSRAMGPEPLPPRAARGQPGALRRLARRVLTWLEQPEAEAPPSRPLPTNFYTEL